MPRLPVLSRRWVIKKRGLFCPRPPSGYWRITERLTCALHYHHISQVLKWGGWQGNKFFISLLISASGQFIFTFGPPGPAGPAAPASPAGPCEDEGSSRLDGQSRQWRAVAAGMSRSAWLAYRRSRETLQTGESTVSLLASLSSLTTLSLVTAWSLWSLENKMRRVLHIKYCQKGLALLNPWPETIPFMVVF